MPSMLARKARADTEKLRAPGWEWVVHGQEAGSSVRKLPRNLRHMTDCKSFPFPGINLQSLEEKGLASYPSYRY